MPGPPKDYYSLRMLNVPSRLGLSTNAQMLLMALDEYRRGLIDSTELGRQVRLSPNKRQAITDAITKCASYMKRKPDEVKSCIEVIQSCTEILTIADSGLPHNHVFPFMKLPTELREKVLREVIGRPRYPVFNTTKMSTCPCAKHEKPSWYGSYALLNLGIARTSKTMRKETMVFLYKNYTVDFSCTCEMEKMLVANEELAASVRSVRVYWVGKAADTAFLKLAECPDLRKLTILISRSTTNKLNKREEGLTKFFPARRSTRVTEALGLDELLTIRGLTEIDVQHVGTKISERRSDDEKASLTDMLNSKLMLPRD